MKKSGKERKSASINSQKNLGSNLSDSNDGLGKEKQVSRQKHLLKHFLYLKGTLGLTENDLVEFFGPENVYDVNNHLQDTSYVVLNSATLEKFINSFQNIKGQKVVMKPFTADPDSKSYKRFTKTEEKVEEIENRLANSHMATRKHIKVVDPVQKLQPGETKTWIIRINNDGPLPVSFQGIKVPRLRPDFEILTAEKKKSITLGTGRETSFTVKFSPKDVPVGTFRQLIFLEFRETLVPHWIIVKVEDDQDFQILQPDGDYKPYVPDEEPRQIIPAFSTLRPNPYHYHTDITTLWVEKLDEFPIPENCQKQVDSLSRYSGMNPWKTRENYRSLLHNLLWTEEAHLVKTMRMYDLKGVKFEQLLTSENNQVVFYYHDAPRTIIPVPGLADGRPSVLPHDSIYAWVVDTADYEYEGWVERVEKDRIQVIFCEDFHKIHPPETRFNVRFSFSRMEMRQRHRAVDKANIDLVWPQALPLFQKSNSIEFFDKKLDKDQRATVESFVNGYNGNVPFLLFGPFGTGKTRTINEIIRQLAKRKKKVLVCTKSNSACEIIVKELSQDIPPDKLFRLMALYRKIESVPKEVLPYTRYNGNLFVLPTVEEIKTYDIIVSTCTTSDGLFGIGVGKDHFTHIILDEAGQLLEADALIPLNLAKIGTSILLAGDDKQLGPMVHSPSCIFHKMDISIMERMATLEVYSEINRRNIRVNLTTNYRCDPQLVEFPSIAFYNSTIKSAFDSEYKNLYSGWSKLKNKIPYLFCAVEGKDLRESDSPSFFNILEASAVVNLILDLMEDQRPKVSATDIGVVTPYHKQVQKIRKLLSFRHRIFDIKVGTPAEFQGLERRILFISTVRSSPQWMVHDRKFNLGMIHNPKQFNTALTRASELVVVVGDPYALYKDKFWRRFIEFCAKKGATLNCPELDEKYFQRRELQEQSKSPITEESIIDDKIISDPLEIDQSKRFEEKLNNELLTSSTTTSKKTNLFDLHSFPALPTKPDVNTTNAASTNLNGNAKEGISSPIHVTSQSPSKPSVNDNSFSSPVNNSTPSSPMNSASTSQSFSSTSSNSLFLSPQLHQKLPTGVIQPPPKESKSTQDEELKELKDIQLNLLQENPVEINKPSTELKLAPEFKPSNTPIKQVNQGLKHYENSFSKGFSNFNPNYSISTFTPIYSIHPSNHPLILCQNPAFCPPLTVETEDNKLLIHIFHCGVMIDTKDQYYLITTVPENRPNLLFHYPSAFCTLLINFGTLFSSKKEIHKTSTLLTISLYFSK